LKFFLNRTKNQIRSLGFILLFIFPFTAVISVQAHGTHLAELEFKDAKLMDAIRIISELSGSNIVATPEASKTNVTIFLRNVNVHTAIETICRVNNLWYRRNPKTRTYRIMTNKEYSQDLVIHRDDKSRVFTLRNPNIGLVADSIANLYGSRVLRSESGESTSSNDSSDNSNSTTSSNSSSTSNSSSSNVAKDTVEEKLSIDQLSALQVNGNGNNLISAQQLQHVTAQKEPIYVTVVAEHNLVIVRTGDASAMDSIATLIEDLDRPIPQVLLEMKIMDVLVGDDFKSVFNFEVIGSKLSGDSTNPILFGNNGLINGGFVFEYLNDRLKANIEFLEQDKRINILSTPMVLATNNRPAKLFVGEEQVIVQGYGTVLIENEGDNVTINRTTIVPTTTIKEIGNTIEITPYINADKTITLSLRQESSSLKSGGGKISVVSGSQVLTLPIDTVNTARLDGTVIAKDGLTIAVGGLVRETKSTQESKVPWLSDIPLIGKLFTSTQDLEERSELILMITPHVMITPDDYSKNYTVNDANNTLSPQINKDTHADNIQSFRCLEQCRL
jgi:general secretion pathway protein D